MNEINEMKNFIDLNDILSEFIKPEKKTLKEKFFPNEEVLKQKFAKYLRLKDMLKIEGWQTDMKEKMTNAIRTGMGKLLRPSSLGMTEAEIKSIMAEIQGHLRIIADIKYDLDEGVAAARSLGEIDASKSSKRNAER